MYFKKNQQKYKNNNTPNNTKGYIGIHQIQQILTIPEIPKGTTKYRKITAEIRSIQKNKKIAEQ